MTLHFRQSAPRDSGHAGTIVFVHGFPFTGEAWADQLGALPDGWRGIAPDLRGFGATDIHAVAGEVPTGRKLGGRIARDDEPVLTMTCFARDLAELIDAEADGEAVVCGLSMGGYAAFELWRRHPDRVRALVLADTRASADDDEGRENRYRMAQTVRKDGMEPVARAMTPSLLSEKTRQDAPDVVARVRDMILRTPPRTAIAALAGMAARHDATDELPTISVPTLVIAGEHDALTPPEHARVMTDAIPDASIDVIPDAGHLSNMERPAAFNRALASFLTGL